MAQASAPTASRLSRPTRSVLASIAALAWLALVLQLLLMVQQTSPGSRLEAVIQYFSFFTILTNLLVALTTSVPVLAPGCSAGQFFLRPSVQTATAVYIAIVGVTYSLLLRQLWNPQGAQKVADVLLHDVVPVLYVAFWAFLVPKWTLRWSDAVRWLGYPIVYMLYTLVHGSISHWYPYSFIDVDTIGWSRSLIHAAELLLAFFGVGLMFISIGRWTARTSQRRAPIT